MKRLIALLCLCWSLPAAAQPEEPGRLKAGRKGPADWARRSGTVGPAGRAAQSDRLAAEPTPPPTAAQDSPAAIIDRVAQQCHPGTPCPLWPQLVRLAMDPVHGPACLAQVRRLGDCKGALLAAMAAAYGATKALRIAGQQTLEVLAMRPSCRVAVSHIAYKHADKLQQAAAIKALGPFVKARPSSDTEHPPTVAKSPPATQDRTGPEVDSTRLVYGQTAVTRKKGSFSWNVFNLGWHTFDYGVTDYLQIGIGTLVPVGVFGVLPSVKLGMKIPGSEVYLGLHAQGGVLFPYIMNDDALRIGVYGGGPVLTVVSGMLTFNVSVPIYGLTAAQDKHVFAAPGNSEETEYDHAWVAAPNIGFGLKVSDHVSLNLEAYAPLSGESEINGKLWVILYGLRISGENLHGDISFVVPIFPEADEILKYAPLGFPLLGLGYRW